MNYELIMFASTMKRSLPSNMFAKYKNPRLLTKLRVHFSLLAALFFMSMANSASIPTVEQIVQADIWAVAKGTHHGKPLVIRYRSGFSVKPNITDYPKLIHVTWRYKLSENGLPDNAASNEMAVFEDRLIGAAEPSGQAALVAVITNDGTREWVFYARNVAKFGELLNAIPQESQAYPIKLTAETDSEWSFFYGRILSGVK
jgi:hypothetical protein